MPEEKCLGLVGKLAVCLPSGLGYRCRWKRRYWWCVSLAMWWKGRVICGGNVEQYGQKYTSVGRTANVLVFILKKFSVPLAVLWEDWLDV